MVVTKKSLHSQEAIPNSTFFDNAGLQYEEWYGHAESVHTSLRRFLELLPPNGPVLDCGCGTGAPGALMIATEGKRQLHGIDFSANMVELSRKRVPSATFEHVDMLKYNPASKFAGIVAMLSLFELTRAELEEMASKWAAWLEPGGILLIGVFGAEDCKTVPSMFDADKKFASQIPFMFMHHETLMNLFTKVGWKDLMSENKLDVVYEDSSIFKPPPEAGAEDEPYYMVIAEKLA